MKKNIVFLTLIAALLLAACGTPAATPAAEEPTAEAPQATDVPASGAVEITFWSWVPHIEEQVNAFNASQTAIKVNYVNAGGGSGEYDKLKVALQANTDVPDVVQIEYQLVPSFIAQDALLDLTAYGANDVKDKFIPWTWAQVSQGDAVYAYPQDAGPMVMFCNDEVLSKHGITAPTTWDEFASSAAKLHAADPNAYLSNFTADQGWFFGVLWQSGARPFAVNGENVTVNFTSPEAVRVAKLWGDLIKSGNLSPVDTYTNDWNTALGNGSVACWPSGSWGTFISASSPDFAGKWKVYPMPQWTAGDKINGNYGGSSIAVTKASAHPKEAAAFAQWLNVDPATTLALTDPAGAGLFPVTQGTLADPKWKDVTYDYWSGQAIHQTMLEAAQQVDVNFAWSPFTDFVFTTYADEITNVKAGTTTFEQALQNLQDKVVAYGKDQGFTVNTP
jgi:multiple sugar transport system substrate-binding protein